MTTGIAVKMAGVAQLVRAPVCGTGCRRFKSGHSPHFFVPAAHFLIDAPILYRVAGVTQILQSSVVLIVRRAWRNW